MSLGCGDMGIKEVGREGGPPVVGGLGKGGGSVEDGADIFRGCVWRCWHLVRACRLANASLVGNGREVIP